MHDATTGFCQRDIYNVAPMLKERAARQAEKQGRLNETENNASPHIDRRRPVVHDTHAMTVNKSRLIARRWCAVAHTMLARGHCTIFVVRLLSVAVNFSR